MFRRIKKPWWILLSATVVLAACGAEEEAQETLEEIDPPQFVDEQDELGLEDSPAGTAEEDMDGVMDDGTDEDMNMEEDDMHMDEKGGMTHDDEMDENMDGNMDEEMDEDMDMEEKGGAMMEETAMRELYLMDRNGMVTPQTFALPSTDDELAQSISYLIKGGPVTDLLPNGFQAVLPPDTQVINAEVTEDGEAVVDFSQEFTEYRAEDELRVLQSVTWTATQFDGVERVHLRVNGEELKVMPQNGTPVSEGYSRSHGINLEPTAISDISNTKPVTVYFLSQPDDETYYVPVTRRVPANADVHTAVVDELLKGPGFATSLLTDFRTETALLDEPRFRNGTVELNFNEGLLSQMEGTALSEHVVNMIVLSLTEQEDVEQVSITVNDEDQLMVSSGATLTEPVTRPGSVNTGKY
ncbi:GerMN domain-containing protein [Alteribacter natronophilus]|uniref:GerMN domain-containing protein n=1 Tax=Alteribacter natronophilus TaxID=2583810 RepID=UPI00110EE97B|nr:GerMN domain-containing protein [Alteribacter natronophilus]TMW71629.1 sporulation protein [Alteribacter natronophilus]